MKKIIAVVLITLTVLFCFAGCKKKADKVAAVVTNRVGEVVAAVTNEDGNAVRDGAGNIVVVVTDADGNVLEDDNGEMLTEQIIVDSFMEIGNRYEMPEYSIVIPDKWKNSNNNSHNTLVLKEDGTDNKISIIVNKDDSIQTVRTENQNMFSAISSVAGDVTSGSDTFKVLDQDAEFVYAYTAEKDVFLGYITFVVNGNVYSVMMTGKENMADKVDEIKAILNTMDIIV